MVEILRNCVRNNAANIGAAKAFNAAEAAVKVGAAKAFNAADIGAAKAFNAANIRAAKAFMRWRRR